MKKLICLYLSAIILFCSCTMTDTEDIMGNKNGESDLQNGGTYTAEPAAEDTQTVSSVRYLREYDIQKCFALNNAYFAFSRSGLLYVSTAESVDGTYRHKWLIFDQTGNCDVEYPPTANEFRTNENRSYDPFFAYPLSDGRYYQIYRSQLSYMQAITDRDGKVVQKEPLDSAIKGIYAIGVYEDTDQKLHILFSNTRTLYYCDSSLTLKKTYENEEISPGMQTPVSLDNGSFCIGSTADSMFTIDIRNSTAQSLALNLPAAYAYHPTSIGTDGQIYVKDDNGLLKYHADKQPELILKWSECGMLFSGSDRYWILNDETVVLAREEEILGTTASQFYLISISERPQTPRNKTVISLLSYQSAQSLWLSSAVYQFNRTNERYYVNLTFSNTHIRDERAAEIEAMLLSNGGGIDMLIPFDESDLSAYYDKQAFWDLSPWIGSQLLNCIRTLYNENGQIYLLPMSFSFTAFTAKKEFVGNAPLTWESVYRLRDTLAPNALLAVPAYDQTGNLMIFGDGIGYAEPAFNDLCKQLYEYSVDDYINAIEKKAGYDSDAFHHYITFLDWLSQNIDKTAGGIEMSDQTVYLPNASLINRIRDNGAVFLEVSISSIKHLSVLQRFYGRDEYVICGYPSEYGSYIRLLNAVCPVSVLESSSNKEGCLEFLSFLLSDEQQNSAALSGLPVTVSALREQIDQNRYFYYNKWIMKKLDTPDGGELYLNFPGTYPTYVDDYGIFENTEQSYDVFSISDQTAAAMMDFFEHADIRTKSDQTVLEIVNEELSYWKNGVRSLEETTKIIDSRVWIYLNE